LLLRGHGSLIFSLAFAPDGKTIASSSADHTARLWDLSTGKERFTLRGHTQWVYAVAWSPNGKSVASGSCAWDTDGSGQVKVWDPANGMELASLGAPAEGIMDVKFVGDEKSVLVCYRNGSVKLWDVPGQKVRQTLQPPGPTIHPIACDREGKILA